MINLIAPGIVERKEHYNTVMRRYGKYNIDTVKAEQKTKHIRIATSPPEFNYGDPKFFQAHADEYSTSSLCKIVETYVTHGLSAKARVLPLSCEIQFWPYTPTDLDECYRESFYKRPC